MLRNDAVKLCQENNFNTGFFEGSDNNCVVDAYELKVMILFKTWDTSLVCFWFISYIRLLIFCSISIYRSDLSTFLRGLH